jgi:hypothetical protein
MNDTKVSASNKTGSGEQESISGVSLLSSIKFKSWLGILFLTIIPLFSVGYYSFDVLTGISRNLLIESNIQAFQQVKYEVDQYVSMYEDLGEISPPSIRVFSDKREDLRFNQVFCADLNFIF